MRITFHGAAGEVTGSKHLIQLAGRRILLDCGMWQGRRSEANAHNREFAFDPASIDAVVISHAHFDHVGLLPLLIKRGFRGKIYSTGATRDLTELILLDAAKLQEQETEFLNRKRYPGEDILEPLYTMEDVPAVMSVFVHIPYVNDNSQWHEIALGVRLKLYDAGHILGSTIIVLEGEEKGRTRRLVYTGDLGRKNAPLLRDPVVPGEDAEMLILESTYGTRLHHPIAQVEHDLVEVMNEAARTNGKIIVPAFSLGRTQMLIYMLHLLSDQGKIPRLPIIIDSPLASRITAAFAKHQKDYDAQSKQDFTVHGEDPLAFRNLSHTESVEESKALNTKPGPYVIISASGMASGGRIMHHLKNNLSDPSAIILFTGYQAVHTPGRRLVEGAHFLRIFGHDIPVRAKIRVMNDLSAHADAEELADFCQNLRGLRHIALVHGEGDRAQSLHDYLKRVNPNWDIVLPSAGQTVEW